jgi:hypothetical protein
MLAGSIPTRVGRPLVQGQFEDLLGAGVVERHQDLPGLLGLVGDPATDRRVIGAATGGEQDLEDVLDLTKADAGGEGDGGHLAELGRIADDRELGGSAQGLDLIAKPLILGEEFVVGGGVEALLELASVLVERLAATASLLGLVGDRPIDLGEDGGGVADPGRERLGGHRGGPLGCWRSCW